MNRVTSKALAKTGKIQIRSLYAVPPSIKQLPDPPIARPASPTTPSRVVAQQNQSSTQNPPASSSSLKPTPNSSSTNATPLLLPLPSSGNGIRNLPLWLLSLSGNPHAQPQLPNNYRLSAAAHGIAKPRNVSLPEEDTSLNRAVQVGEDAYFVSQRGLGVADGVGGWASSKHAHHSARQFANSSLFSRRLMHFCSLELQSSEGEPDPVVILQKAYTTALGLSIAEGLVGSSTALLAVLAKNGHELRVAHVGDCCLYLIRDKEIVFRSAEMQHRFNYPLQLGPLSPTTPQEHAQSMVLPVRENDIIILSTDGMSDNLWDEDVIEQLSRLTSPDQHSTSTSTDRELAGGTTGTPNAIDYSPLRTALLPTTLSHSLCTRARTVSESGVSSADTPFSRRAKEEGIDFVGGKPDDITVAVAVVSKAR